MKKQSTLARLTQLRSLFQQQKPTIHAYIVPSEDAHQSEYIAERDCRRAFISGFDGSAGKAIVATNAAALWTDGRYWLQAETQLDSNWTLMKAGAKDTLTEAAWLKQTLQPGQRVGVDPRLMAHVDFTKLADTLRKDNLELVAVENNLIDAVWDDQPAKPCAPIVVHHERYAGMRWQDKAAELRATMEVESCGLVVLTALDEIAWFFNLRGNDIVYNPVFHAYAAVTPSDILLFVDTSRFEEGVAEHVQPAIIHSYDSFEAHLKELVAATADCSQVWVTERCSQAIVGCIPESKLKRSITPVETAKAVKNQVELEGMRQCHVRDAVALAQHFLWLEKTLAAGAGPDVLSEAAVADRLAERRRQQDLFVSLSFDTISSIGANGAIIHYKPELGNCDVVDTERVYLCDSGGQYRDGTTDVTRTVHFGQPTQHEKDCFTRVLQGHIALSRAKFPKGTKGRLLDPIARAPMWAAGLDYSHGTGHGVGSFLNVHEGPMQISYRPKADRSAIEVGQIVTIEPGYYETGAFGVRIENVVEVVAMPGNDNYFGFEPVTLFPIQSKMINRELLTAEEVDWLNHYHLRVRQVVGKALDDQGLVEEKAWLERECSVEG
eukprot:m.46133 g.46133  ORF g.46133 m.46133 type:complete len:607 (+) comp13119_c0_seq2:83-1903(+)